MAILEQIEDMFRYPKKMLIEPGAAAARLASPAMQLAIGMGTRPTLNPAVLAGTPPTPVVTSPNNPAAPIGLIPAELAALFSGPGGGLLDDSIRNTALFGLAQGLLAQSGWQAAPVGFGQALGSGLLGMREAEQAALLGMLQRAQMEAAEAETADRERLQAYAESTGDPLAALAPRNYVEQMLENRFPPPPAGYRRTADGNLEAIPGGPEDPAVVASKREQKAPTDREAKIASLVGQGVQPTDAANLVDGLVDTVLTVDGRPIRLDQVKGTATLVPVGNLPRGPQPPPPATAQQLGGATAAVGATAGARNAFERWLEATAGQLWGLIPGQSGLFPESQLAQRVAFQLRNDTMASLSANVEQGRLSNYEQQLVVEAMPSLDFWSNPANAMASVKQFVEFIRSKEIQAMRSADDPGLSVETKNRYLDKVVAYRQLRERWSSVDNTSGGNQGTGGQIPVISTKEEYDDLAPGTEYQDVNGAIGRKSY